MFRKTQTQTQTQTNTTTLNYFPPDSLPDELLLKIIFEHLPLTSTIKMIRVSKKYKNIILQEGIIPYLFQFRRDALQLSPITRFTLQEPTNDLRATTEAEQIQRYFSYLIAELQQRKPSSNVLKRLYDPLATQRKTELTKCLAVTTSRESSYNQHKDRNKKFKKVMALLAEPTGCLTPGTKKIIAAAVIIVYALFVYAFASEKESEGTLVVLISWYTFLAAGAIYTLYYGCGRCTSVIEKMKNYNNASQVREETVPQVTQVSHFIAKHGPTLFPRLFPVTVPNVVAIDAAEANEGVPDHVAIDMPEADDGAPAPDELSPLLR